MDRKYIGIPVSLGFMAAFTAISLFVNQSLHGTAWFLFSSGLRLVFGAAILSLARRIYGKTAWEILSVRNSRPALIAAAGFLIYCIYYIALLIMGTQTVTGLTAGLLFSRVILQQAATGFYEELNYRYLVCEGYFHGERTAGRRLFCAFLSFLIFGALHVVTGWDFDRFLLTGSIGFAFAAMFLCSGNIVIPMILRAGYDMIANVEHYVVWRQGGIFDAVYSVFYGVVGIMTAVSVYMLVKKEREAELPDAS